MTPGLGAMLLIPAILLVQSSTQGEAQTPAQAPTQQGVRAQYDWGYAGMDGEGSGTLSLLVEPSTGRVVAELHGVGERLMFLSGDHSSGYRIQIPRQEIDKHCPTFASLPIPFLPQLGSTEALYRLLSEGVGPGVKIRKRDKLGPVKFSYKGLDEHGKDVMVWMKRTRWEAIETKQQ